MYSKHKLNKRVDQFGTADFECALVAEDCWNVYWRARFYELDINTAHRMGGSVS
jgi:hypothetical protein